MPVRPASVADGRPTTPPPAEATTASRASASIAALLDDAIATLDVPAPPPALVDADFTNPPQPRRSHGLTRQAEAAHLAARLPALPLFAELSPERQRATAQQAGVLTCPAGEALCEAGAPEGPMFVLLEGAASVLVGGDLVGRVAAGDVVGEV